MDHSLSTCQGSRRHAAQRRLGGVAHRCIRRLPAAHRTANASPPHPARRAHPAVVVGGQAEQQAQRAQKQRHRHRHSQGVAGVEEALQDRGHLVAGAVLQAGQQPALPEAQRGAHAVEVQPLAEHGWGAWDHGGLQGRTEQAAPALVGGGGGQPTGRCRTGSWLVRRLPLAVLAGRRGQGRAEGAGPAGPAHKGRSRSGAALCLSISEAACAHPALIGQRCPYGKWPAARSCAPPSG